MSQACSFLVLFTVASQAAEPASPRPIPLSVEDAIARAVARSEAVAIADAGVVRADADVQRAWSDFLPAVFGSASYDRTLETEYEGILDAPSPQPGVESPFANLPFGRPNTWRAGLSVTQNLFAGGRSLARLSLADRSRQISLSSMESARAQAVLTVVQAYYDALLARTLLQIGEENLRQAEATLEQARVANANATAPVFDVLRAEVNVGTQRPMLLQRRAAVANADLGLQQVLDLGPGEAIALTSSLDGPLPDLGPAVAQGLGITEDVRVSVRQAEDLLAMRESSVDVASSQRWPQIDLNMTYGLVNYPEEVAPKLDDVRDNWIAGVSLQVPLFSGFRISADVDAARADVLEARARLRQAMELAALDAQIVERELGTATATLEATRGVVEQARAALNIANIRYREGISTQLEVTDAQILLAQAQANRAQAARDVQIARIRKALLPALPVTTTGAAGAAGLSPAGGALIPIGGAGATSTTGGANAGVSSSTSVGTGAVTGSSTGPGTGLSTNTGVGSTRTPSGAPTPPFPSSR